MLDRMSASLRPLRPAAAAFAGLLLAVLLGACSTSASTPQPRATIAFIVHNETGRNGTYRFVGSASVLPAAGPLDCLQPTRIGATWDPTWSLDINGRKIVASAAAPDLQLGSDPRASLTVIVVIDGSGTRTTNIHPGPPDAGEIPSAVPSPTPACPS
jgi:hypothetical protein